LLWEIDEMMPSGPVLPRHIRPGFIKSYLESIQQTKHRRQQTLASLRKLTGEKANFIGYSDSYYYNELFITETGRLMWVCEDTTIFEWLSTEPAWDGAFLAFLRDEQPVLLGSVDKSIE